MVGLAQTQAQVVQLAGQLKDLRNKVKALALLEALRTKRVLLNIGPVAIGGADHAVTWPVPFADDLYFVAVEIVSGAVGLGTLHAQLKIGTRTPGGCEITVTATAAVAVVALDVLAVRP